MHMYTNSEVFEHPPPAENEYTSLCQSSSSHGRTMDFAYLLQHGGEPAKTVANALLMFIDIGDQGFSFCSCADLKEMCRHCKVEIAVRIHNVFQGKAYIGGQDIRQGMGHNMAELRRVVCLGHASTEEMFWSYSYSEISLALRILFLKGDITPLQIARHVDLYWPIISYFGSIYDALRGGNPSAL